ncbi:hypothetical protein [Brevundimonas sp. M20]|uniref:RipA family octameric membrane protein n=1 Tax=Brevundimonas sp. M20 TaxID=2591463 RepID=UPI0011465389|nr:hypothetical protein [Brevundimonas sp. M20]QDH73312.1 hypothetical protein FKQ52_07650 [Brevundimonas sp. M20]
MIGKKSITDEAAKHAWDWFALHAAQRMQNINFFIVLQTALLAAAGLAIKEQLVLMAILAGTGVVFLTFIFYKLERRVRKLVKIGENALRYEQKRISIASKNDKILLCEIADTAATDQMTYGQLFQAMYIFFAICGIAILFAGGHQICHGVPLIPTPKVSTTPTDAPIVLRVG